MEDETVLERANATLDGLNNIGILELTSRRLRWRAHPVRLPITAIFGDRQLTIPLGEIVTCRAESFVLVVGTADASHIFRLFRWWNPVLLWWKLTRRWAARINEARSLLENETNLLHQKDAPT